MSNLIKVEISDEVVVEVQPHVEHEWLLSSKDVAEGYGLSASGLRMTKSRYSDEILEDIHFVQQIVTGNKGERTQTMWTKEGVVMLGFFIKTPTAKEFRRWASNYIVSKQAEEKAIAIPMTYIEALQAHLESVKQLEEANKVITLQAPKVEIYDSIMATDSLVYPEKAHKRITPNPRILSKILREKEGLFFHDKKGKNTPTTKALEKGWLVIRQHEKDGKVFEQMLYTYKGIEAIERIARKYIESGELQGFDVLQEVA